MSDFDREAERERLREKYEHDREKRQSTQRMSELLLKGATMTNRHCEECGDPIFRYEGTEFCPTCQHDGTVGGSDAAQEADAEGTAAGRPDAEGTAAGRPDAEGGGGAAAAGGEGDGAATDGTTGDGDATGGTEAEGDDAGGPGAGETRDGASAATGAAGASEGRRTGGDTAGGAERSGRHRPGRRAPPSLGTTDDGGEQGEKRTAARTSLERTLVRFAREAEGTDDPRRARDLLAAAREAAEALAALDRR